MVRKLKRKHWLAALGTLAVLAIAGAAIAYFTAGGSGTGKATVGTVTSQDLVIKGDVADGAYLFPGGDAVTVPITVTNNSDTAVKVGTVSLTKVVASGTANAAQCDVTAFTMDPVPVNETVPAHATSDEHSGSLVMNDTGANQDACQGATLTLTYASGAGS